MSGGEVTDAQGGAGHRLGGWLVAAQFGLMALLAALGGPPLIDALGATPQPIAPAVAAGWGLWCLAGALGAWALSANRPGNFRIHPAPHAQGRLVQTGPYRWIRHPMYSAVLAAGAGCALATAGTVDAVGLGRLAWALAGLAWFALAAVLVAKASLEERWLVQRHPGYAAYRQRTRRFVPGLV